MVIAVKRDTQNYLMVPVHFYSLKYAGYLMMDKKKVLYMIKYSVLLCVQHNLDVYPPNCENTCVNNERSVSVCS